MVGSPTFAELLAKARGLCDGHNLKANAPESIQNAIIGKPIADGIPLLHELISGPFDADKLDYMTRDAVMSGVPVVTDMARLVQKVRAVQIPEASLPERVAQNVKQGLPSYL